MTTLKEVAEKAGVSITTVSRVINDSEMVNAETRDRVQKAMYDMGYHPSRVAQRLRGTKGRSKLFGLIIPDIQNAFYSNIVRGIEDVAYKQNYAVILCNSDEDIEKEQFYLEVLRSESVDGIIFPPINQDSKVVKDLVKSGLPLVCVDRRLRSDEVDTVVVDNKIGAYQVTNYLLGLGHKRIGLITSAGNFSSFKERQIGYEQALTEHGIVVDPFFIGYGDQRSTESGKNLVLKMLNNKNRPSALFVTNNLFLLGALEIIHELGLRIPQDISIVGFDDMPWARSFYPPLTVVAQPGYEMGRKAAELLFNRLNDPSRGPSTIVLEPKLTVRGSCKSFRM
jgi:DNA-binding LacI/PurR family transcriptional regulator